MKRRKRICTFLSTIAALLIGPCGVPSLWGQLYAPQPLRLDAKAVRTTIPPGSQSAVSVSFLDRNYKPTSNDARRILAVQCDPPGIVNVRPNIEALPGQREVAIPFAGLKPGRVLIHIVSNGLQPAAALVTIAASRASIGHLIPQAWADELPRVDIVVTSVRPAPANGSSLSPFVVTLDRARESETQIAVESSPASVLLYAGKNTRQAGNSLIIAIPPGEQSSQEINAQTAKAGAVTISAHPLPAGPTAQTTVNFEEPRPVSLAFADSPASVSLGAQNVPLKLQIADQDNIPLSKPDGEWAVSVRSSANTDAIHLEPERLTLSSRVPQSYVLLSLTDRVLSEGVQIFATADHDPLGAAEKQLGFMSSVGRLRVIVPNEVDCNNRTPVTAFFLLKDRDQEAATEFPRTVTFHADQGRFDPESVIVPPGGTEANTVFVSQRSGQRPEIRISTRGVDVVTAQLLVITALWVLVIYSLCGGVIGGLARFFYYSGESWDLMPKKVNSRWNPGLFGNAAFCGVFGLVSLLMAEFSLNPLDPAHVAFTNNLLHTGSGAFLQGIAGGFVGVAILELLAKSLGLADALQRRAQRQAS